MEHWTAVSSLGSLQVGLVTAVQATDALLTSRLGTQARGARLVTRERLRELLESAPEARLVLVSAPAGFGKSTLLADWLGSADVRSAWLSLERRDNDVVRFARYLGAAAARLAGREDDPGSADPSRPFDPELALARLLDPIAVAVAGAPAGGVVLVLDDYHVIDEPAIHGLVAAVVERLPPRARLAIATRGDPPLPVSRLRARGELLEVRAEDLRFTAGEAGELLRASGLDLSTAEIDELTGRSEGWAAVLRLAAVSLRGRPNHEELVHRFGASHRFVLDYVVEEVLAGLPPDLQAFLLRTSILDRLSGPLCEAVTGEPGGQERLETLERANLLIVPLDDERRWYRYHALFADILRARLAMLRPDEIAGLHVRAAAWYLERDAHEEAIAHALRTDDPERAGRMIASASLGRLNAGELGTVRRWLDALPGAVVRGHAQLSASYAWCLVLAAETEGVDERLADAEAALAAGNAGDPVMASMIPVEAALIRSLAGDFRGDIETAIAQARLARSLVPAGLPAVVEATLRGDAAIMLGAALARAGDEAGATEALEASLPDLRAGGNVFATGRCIAELAQLAIARGDPARAVALCESEIARGKGKGSAAHSPAVWTAMARARVELGQPGLADAAARRALELATRAGDGPSARSARETLARTAPLLAGGDGAGAARTGGALVEPLTARELEVLQLVALGRSNRQAATELFVTVGTVKSHVHAIAGKLGAANRVEAVARGRQLGLID